MVRKEMLTFCVLKILFIESRLNGGVGVSSRPYARKAQRDRAFAERQRGADAHRDTRRPSMDALRGEEHGPSDWGRVWRVCGRHLAMIRTMSDRSIDFQ